MLRRVAEVGRMLVRLGAVPSLFLIPFVSAQNTPTIQVNCSIGQSLNGTLSHLNRNTPITISVQGICTEYVSIIGFEGLTVKGKPGAAIQQPGTSSGKGLAVEALSINASRSVTIDGVAIHAGPGSLSGIGIGQNSADIRLRNLTIDGPAAFDLVVREEGQVSLAGVTARDPGFATLGIFDVSDVHIENCFFESTTGSFWHVGFLVASGHVTMQNATIRNFQIGIAISSHGSVDIQSFNTYFPVAADHDVVIDNPAGTNFQGVKVESGSALNIGDTTLRITNAGQPWGYNTAAVWADGSSTLSDQGGHLIISNSQGQGILVSNNSHAMLAGSSITGSGHGGLVVANLSTISAANGAVTLVGGNQPDLFCDSKSEITGTANFAGVPTVNCANLVPAETEPLP